MAHERETREWVSSNYIVVYLEHALLKTRYNVSIALMSWIHIYVSWPTLNVYCLLCVKTNSSPLYPTTGFFFHSQQKPFQTCAAWQADKAALIYGTMSKCCCLLTKYICIATSNLSRSLTSWALIRHSYVRLQTHTHTQTLHRRLLDGVRQQRTFGILCEHVNYIYAQSELR